MLVCFQSFNGSRKAKGIASNTSNKTLTSATTTTSSSSATLSKSSDDDSNEDGNSSDDKVKDKLEELEIEASMRSQVRTMRTGPGKKALKAKKTSGEEKKKKSSKQMTKWETSKLSKKEMSELDRSRELSASEEAVQLQGKRDAYIGVRCKFNIVLVIMMGVCGSNGGTLHETGARGE